MIKLSNLQKVIDQKTVIDIASLSVPAGEVAALVGPAGSGKETLLHLLTGQQQPTVGEIEIAGLDPRRERQAFTSRVGVLFAEDTLYSRLSPQANLRFHCRLRGLPKGRAEDVLAQVGLADHAHTRLDRLSSSLIRRLAFGVAILHEPQVLLLARPFERCDDVTVDLLAGLTRRQADAGAAALILASNPAYLGGLCDAISELEAGRIVSTIRPADEAPPDVQLPFKIPVRLEGSVALVNPADVLFAMSQDGRTYLQTAEDRLPTQYTMTELEARLVRSGFFRAHRGYLVNLQHVKEVIPYTRSSFSLKLNDPAETKIPLSKDAARELRELLGY